MIRKQTAAKNPLKRSHLGVKAVFTGIIVLLVTVAFLVNAIALILSNRYPLAVDLTQNAAYEIGDETKSLLSSLNADVQIDVLATETSFSGSPYLIQAQRILDQYPRHSDRVTLRYVDYASDPTYAASHPDLTLTDGDVLVSCGERLKQLTLMSLFNYAYTATGSMTVESSRAEEAVTGAIVNVLSGEETKIAVLTGNGVQNAENFTALLVNNNFTLTAASIATDALDGYDAAILLAPQTDLSEDAVRSLEQFLYNGGLYGKTLFYAASVEQQPLPNLETFLAEWGVSVGAGAVFESKAERTYQYQPFYPLADYASETYRDMLIDDHTPILLPKARPMETLFAARDGYYTETLLSFAETAGVRPADAGDDFGADDATRWGPMPALVLSSYKVVENGAVTKQSNVVVSSSTAMLDALCLQNSSLTNTEYLLNLFNDLLARADTVHIAPKSLAGKTLGITTKQVTVLGVLLGGVLPLSILLAGVFVWLYRRYQ